MAGCRLQPASPLCRGAQPDRIRPITLGGKNWLFAGSDAGGERAAAIYTLTETARLNGLDPRDYLTQVLKRIAIIR